MDLTEDLLHEINEKMGEYFPDCDINLDENVFTLSNCLEFQVEYNEMYYIDITYINGGIYTGTGILLKMEELCLNFPDIIYIRLEDTSNIQLTDSTGNLFEFPLSTIYITASGISWYNKYGYYQKTFQEDYLKYVKIINKQFLSTFIDIRNNLDDLNSRESNYLYHQLISVHKIIFHHNTQDKRLVILRCLDFLLNNMLHLIHDEFYLIKEVGNVIKNSKHINDDLSIYLKYIFLTFMDLLLQHQWVDDDEMDDEEGIYLIKFLYI